MYAEKICCRITIWNKSSLFQTWLKYLQNIMNINSFGIPSKILESMISEKNFL